MWLGLRILDDLIIGYGLGVGLGVGRIVVLYLVGLGTIFKVCVMGFDYMVGLSKAELNHVIAALEVVKRLGEYYGPREQFWKRHEGLYDRLVVRRDGMMVDPDLVMQRVNELESAIVKHKYDLLGNYDQSDCILPENVALWEVVGE